MYNSTTSDKTASLLNLPIVPLREIVVFPGMMIPFIVGRRESINAVKEALTMHNKVFLVTQKDPEIKNPGAEDIFPVGTVSNIVQNIKQKDGSIKVLIEGERRARIISLSSKEAYLEVSLQVSDVSYHGTYGKSEISNELMDLFKKYIDYQSGQSTDNIIETLDSRNLDSSTDTIASHLNILSREKQELLETFNPVERAIKLKKVLKGELEKLEVDERINNSVKSQIEKAQKEYYLNEKIKAIKKELGRKGGEENEIEELRERIKKAEMPEKVEEKALKEVDRLESMPSVSAEATVSRTYVDWLIDMPWRKYSEESKDLEKSQKILDEDHYGLEKIKDRILDYLAVKELVEKPKAGILCFVGPPGVGKTSLAKSIARATGREFVRLSLGGVKDEAEIRGHRRTYIGAFPGQIVQKIKSAGTRNPVFLLDEVDKIGASFRGDPSSALLEVLDPEQNHSFTDHFLDVEFDLSDVMFISTANLLDPVPAALKDRMEVIELNGYTYHEKIKIAEKFLVPKQLEAHGLKKDQLEFAPPQLEKIIDKYTRESGVRNLEREIGKVCRKAARKLVLSGDRDMKIGLDEDDLEEYLGIPRYISLQGEKESQIGLASGLAVTGAGGEILLIEASLMPGEGKLRLTGSLGDIMQESAQAGLSYVRANCERFKLESNFHKDIDIHLHVPQGAVPKDGPSAGVTITAAFLSALRKLPVKREFAMTGEVTLRGRILKIGGVKEKVLAAHRAGLKHIILPRENERDREEIPAEILSDLTIHFVDSMDEVLELVFDDNVN